MNRKEPLHESLLVIMDEMEKMMDIGIFYKNPNGFEELDATTTKLVLAGADLLKAEWERVKTGEKIYRAGKWITGIILAASFSILMAVLLFYKSADVAAPATIPPPTHTQSPNVPKP